jgi:hypothetical protein
VTTHGESRRLTLSTRHPRVEMPLIELLILSFHPIAFWSFPASPVSSRIIDRKFPVGVGSIRAPSRVLGCEEGEWRRSEVISILPLCV